VYYGAIVMIIVCFVICLSYKSVNVFPCGIWFSCSEMHLDNENITITSDGDGWVLNEQEIDLCLRYRDPLFDNAHYFYFYVFLHT
jgi:hypothetical protein